MNRISFDTVMGFYPDHNAWAYRQLLASIRDTGNVVPFVGAGLSAFCGYPSWPSFLTKMSVNILDLNKREIVLKQIKEGELIEAAQEIQNGYHYFLRRLQEEFSPKILADCPDADVRSSAVWILPYLFPATPAVTTNFDQVLETVYEQNQHRFSDTLDPQQLCQRTQARQQRHHALLKLHGSIGATINHHAIVLTKAQYDDAYLPDSPLVKELTYLFEYNTLFFLGCSLQMDRTLEVLRKLQPSSAQLTHFAILGCAPETFDDRVKQLATLGIIPIFYDDTDPKNHDSVRAILERLLYETNPDAYQKLDAELHCFRPPVKQDDILIYDPGQGTHTDQSAVLTSQKQFYSSSATNRHIAAYYAKILLTMSTSQVLKNRSRIAELLRNLYHRHPDCQEVVVPYAKFLSNLSYTQPLKNRTHTAKQLEELYDRHPNWQAVAVQYANSLDNLSYGQSPEDCSTTIERLKGLYDSHPDWPEIAVRYTDSLVNLALAQTTESAVRQTLSKSKSVLDYHSGNPEIQLRHAMTWFNLTLVQSESDIPDTVSDIASFLKEHRSAIPKFKEALDRYLAQYPNHIARYQLLLEL